MRFLHWCFHVLLTLFALGVESGLQTILFSIIANGQFNTFPSLPGVFLDANKLKALGKDSGFTVKVRRDLPVDGMLEAIKEGEN